jgi:ribonucleoside-triphosphate reductase
MMRDLEEIEKDLEMAREELVSVEGAPAEVYSRIVGYYRSVRNWNKGKREEYGERRVFNADACARTPARGDSDAQRRMLLFVRPACPACPSAKMAAGKLGIPVDTIDADTEAGLAEAARRNVMSTPTAILLSSSGEELGRARDSGGIAELRALVA